MSARLHRLANGVRVVCDPMPGLESSALSVVVHGGARWEPPARNGWSHLLEHMVFKGAGARSSRAIVEAIEAQGGWINAATDYERTSFQVRFLSDGLALALEVVADLLLRPTLGADDLAREKTVIAQEIAEAVDTPDDHVFELAQGEAFGEQPLGRPILGYEASLAPADVATLEAWRADLYADPRRLVVSAAGAVDEDALLRLAEAAFGALAPVQTLAAPTPARFTGGATAQTRALEQAHLVLMLPGVSARDDDYFAQRLFVEVLGGGMASRLFQEARETRGLAYAIDAYAEVYEDTGVLGVYAGAAPKDAAPLARLAAQEIGRLAADGPTDAELSRARAQGRSQLFMARESPLTRAEQAAGQALLFDRTFAAVDLAEAIDAVDAAALRRYGARALAGPSAAVVLGRKRASDAPAAFVDALTAG